MNKLTPAEILSNAACKEARPAMERTVIREKEARRAATLVCDHPAYAARAPIGGAARGALVQDLLEGRTG